jgi:hypothetical protein
MVCPLPVFALWLIVGLLAEPCLAGLSLSGGGLTLVQEGPAADSAGDPVPTNLALGRTPFATSELGPQLGLPYHFITNLNDGFYGNAYSWIGADDNPFPETFAGIDLGANPVSNIQSIAFGRSNVLSGDVCGGICTDRHLGFYTLQYTQVANPSSNLGLETTGNPANGWSDIGTLDYGDSDGAGTNYNRTWERHRYNFNPVSATGVRLVVPSTGLGGGTAIDEIELYNEAGPFVPPPPPPPPMRIEASAGFAITWDGNDGDHFDPLAPPDGAIVPDNLALASNGSVPFASSDLGPQLGIAFHVTENINDGFYGNSNSWIGGDDNPFDPDRFAGVAFPGPLSIGSVAWGRDNGNDVADACGGQCMDRWSGLYTLQFTSVDNPGAATANTGNATTGWQTIGTVRYTVADDTFTPYYRHEYDISANGGPITATGLRLLVPQTGLGLGTAIDELEAYVGSVAPGDLDGDGDCDATDIDILAAAIRSGNADVRFDLNNDRLINRDDHRHMITQIKHTWIGDADLNGEFNSSDLVRVFTVGEYEDVINQNSGWADGDWDGNGEFTSSDFVAAFQDGGYERGPRPAAAAVPEPGSIIPVIVACTGLWRRRYVHRQALSAQR